MCPAERKWACGVVEKARSIDKKLPNVNPQKDPKGARNPQIKNVLSFVIVRRTPIPESFTILKYGSSCKFFSKHFNSWESLYSD